MSAFRIMLAAALLAGIAGAEEPRWKFAKGDVRTYDAETSFDWTCAIQDAKPGGVAKLTAHQEEAVTLRLEVTGVSKDGVAEIAGTFTAVRVKSTMVAGTAAWDSTKEKTTKFLGLKKYEALKDVAFTATVSPAGEILDAKHAAIPEPATTPAGEDEYKETSAFAMHAPTAPRAWLELIFRPVPPAKKGERRSIRFIADENCALSFSRLEKVGTRSCAKIEIETPDRKNYVNPEDIRVEANTDPNDAAWEATRRFPKKADAWFCAADGCLARLEGECNAGVSYTGNVVSARMTWKVELQAPSRK